MNAKEFYDAFIGSLSVEQFDNEYKSDGKWTRRIDYIVSGIILNANLSFEKEYYRIDYIGWKERKDTVLDEAKDVEMNPCLWDLKVAVEHENKQNDWTYELVKLVHISCPLKVIIGYSPCDERGPCGLEENRLQFAAELMKKVEAFKNTSDDEYLVILGNSKRKNTNNPSYNDFGYRGYIYNKKQRKFCEIPD